MVFILGLPEALASLRRLFASPLSDPQLLELVLLLEDIVMHPNAAKEALLEAAGVLDSQPLLKDPAAPLFRLCPLKITTLNKSHYDYLFRHMSLPCRFVTRSRNRLETEPTCGASDLPKHALALAV